MGKKFVAIFFVLSFFLFADRSHAQIQELMLRVDGLACPFCAWGLEKKVMKLNGVTSYDIDMRKGIVHIGLKEDASIELERVRRAVKEAGFTLRKILLRATGTVQRDEIGYALIVGGSHKRLLLFEEGEMAEKLKQYSAQGKEVLIEGPVHERQGVPSGLGIEQLQEM